jgi:hypothetical protein
MAESIEKKLKRQREHETKEFGSLQKNMWDLKPLHERIAYELLTFLNQELPNQESHMARLHIYELSPELQRKFKLRLIEKGLIKV